MLVAAAAAIALSAGAFGCVIFASLIPRLSFEVTFPASIHARPLDGRVFLIISSSEEGEPRFQAASWRGGQPLFAMDVDGLEPGEPAVIDSGALGFPLASIDDLPAGDYNVQALINIYTTFHRADGHTIKAHMDQWEGQHWNISPGNLYSDVQRVHLDPRQAATIQIDLTNVIPPIEQPQDTKYIKHVKIRSDLLSDFWGQDFYVGAIVLVPDGFEDHPEAHYPVAYYQGHFHNTFYTPVGFSEEPADPGLSGYDRTYAEASYKFYEDWTSGKLPRMIIVTLQHPNPFFDDSYAVNSANVGPYGDALTQELLPYVEEKFRAIGDGWARTLYGGSTGGWETLAWQVFYPEMFSGAWVNCPDPIDFRYYQLVNIYEDDNAFYPDSEWVKDPIRPFMHDVDGQVRMTLQQASQLEQVLGTRGRSGEQLDIWQAVYGPVGDDGYPKPIWDKRTGVIDHGVAEYMRDNYDLSYILRRDWATLGPKLVGKIHIAVGDEDTFYLEEAVRLLEEFLEGTTDPYYAGSVKYGPRHPHCYSGPPDDQSVRLTRLSYNQRFLPKMAEQITRTAPRGADMSWKY
ncbi:MAG: alpha/beta hydrolase-fold protein [Acidobacteriota bacterium]